MLTIAAAAGYPLAAGDHGRLAVRAEITPALPARPDVIAVHPGVSAPARAYPLEQWKQVVRDLTDNGWTVVVTGSAAERTLTAEVASAAVDPATVVDRGGQDDLASLASVLRSAHVVVAANTGPAHLAAAVGTPVVSLFAPVVDERLWAPYGVPTIVLGDRDASCRGTRSRICPVRGHPCLSSVAAESVVAAVDALAYRRSAVSA
jgi:ADP-heptose:LPS heptosyltransferase